MIGFNLYWFCILYPEQSMPFRRNVKTNGKSIIQICRYFSWQKLAEIYTEWKHVISKVFQNNWHYARISRLWWCSKWPFLVWELLCIALHISNICSYAIDLCTFIVFKTTLLKIPGGQVYVCIPDHWSYSYCWLMACEYGCIWIIF